MTAGGAELRNLADVRPARLRDPGPPDDEQPADDAATIEASWTEPERFAALFDRHASLIHRYIARRTDPAIADDLVAETFLAAFRRRQRFDLSCRDARPWLYGIATNLIGQHRRDESRQLRIRRVIQPDLDPPGHADQVTANVTASGTKAVLARALAELPAAERDVLLAYLAKLNLAAASPPSSGEPANWMANDLGKAVGQLMSTTYLLPAQQSAIFRLLARTPGFQIVRSADDSAGRPGVGIYWAYQGGGAMITFDPATYAFLGFGTWAVGRQPVLTGHNVTAPYGSALTAMTIVNALPRQRSGQLTLASLIPKLKRWAVKTHQHGSAFQVLTAYLREVWHLSPAKVQMTLRKLGLAQPRIR